jgi:hypothetical protein
MKTSKGHSIFGQPMLIIFVLNSRYHFLLGSAIFQLVYNLISFFARLRFFENFKRHKSKTDRKDSR